jgi:two-component system, chemotaxis family, CheB/CheR fusion protein
MAENDAGTIQAGGEAHNSKLAIVGVGASAGGVQALQAFFAALPDSTDAAYVVVVHLDPHSQSELPSILAARTRMRVAQVVATQKLRPDHVYVIPPDRRLRITDHEISAPAFDEPRGQRAPIDLFFRSLAEKHQEAFAVILTGGGSDGAIGVRAVKEAGGIVLVQDPDEAEYPSMPRSAIATGAADFIMPVTALATRLAELLRNGNGIASPDSRPIDEDVLRRVLVHVRTRTGHDFSKYKRSTILRRIARRIQVTGADDIKAYYDFLRENTDEPQALMHDLLISVTTFFRDADVFEALRTQVIPHLFHDKSDSLRVWVPGCATGEEVYSLGMMLLDEAARREFRMPIQVFGSDLDGRALTLAREGRYPAAIEADVGEDRLRRYFTREGDHYRVRRDLRDVVLFASHSLLRDPPFSRIDLISCRNVLIYLDRELQQQVCGTFHYALNAGGYLLLGSSETADSPPGLFRSIDRAARIYQSVAVAGDKPRLLPRLLGNMGVHEQGARFGRPPSANAQVGEAAIHRLALETVAPPSILVDETHRVLHMSENAGRFLQPSGGTLSGDVVDLVRSELRFELRSALNRAFEHGRSTLTLPIAVKFNGAAHRAHMQVSPTGSSNGAKSQTAIVLFLEGEAADEVPTPPSGEHDSVDAMVRRLSEELQLTQGRLRTTREEYEAANEELRAANEELQSINEEHRSTSEELETSKEELQSMNEELQTVNSELKLKLEAVSRAHSDLQNVMAATDFGILFLDSGLRIKRFTEQVTDLFRIMPTDEGRPVTDFAHLLEYDDLVKDAQGVLAQLTPVRREIHSRSDRWFDVRLRPYRTIDNKIDGVVITFVDVTDRRNVEQALRRSEELLQQKQKLVDLSRDAIFIWDFDGAILEWNRGSEELYGYSRDEALAMTKDRLLGTSPSAFAEMRAALLKVGDWTGEVQHRTKDGRDLTVASRIVLEDVEGRRLALESTRDITERKMWEEQQRLLLGELTHRVKNVLTVVQSIAHQSLRSGPQGDFLTRFDGRLSALGAAHNLLVGSNWQGADLKALAHSQLQPYASDNPERLHIEGEPISLPHELAGPFSLVLHELATNAAKHGALSLPAGSVHLSWATDEGARKLRTLVVRWKEEGGPPVKRPKATGFGSSLIENGIPHSKVTREFRPEGLVCTIAVPMPAGG